MPKNHKSAKQSSGRRRAKPKQLKGKPNVASNRRDNASPAWIAVTRGATRDLGFTAIVALLAAIALWLLATPWISSVAQASMRRFHLTTPSFVAWAVQFPIPTMYNFSNRFEVTRYPPGLVDPLFDESEKRHINHFPVRCITFAGGRYTHLHDGADRWITVDTSYRGQTLETRFHAKAKPDGGFELVRLSSVGASQ